MDRECSIWLKCKGTLKEGDQQFGSWLRAFTLNLSRKIVVRVAGFKDEDSGDQGRKDNNDTEVGSNKGEKEVNETVPDAKAHGQAFLGRMWQGPMEDNGERRVNEGTLCVRLGTTYLTKAENVLMKM